MRRVLLAAVTILVLAVAALVGGCADPEPPAADRGPAPRMVGGLRVLAESDASGFRLHTASGPMTFMSGVNLGSTTPLHQPGEVGTIDAAHYRRWLGQMGALGIRFVRVYTLHPPAFYDELARYNRAHPRAPLYLVQGVYLPDESYVEPGGSLYDRAVDAGFSAEIADVSDAVHGDLVRRPTPGRASGRYRTDVSPWLAAWIIGVEWDPKGTVRTDRLSADAPYRPGPWFAATPTATATERWIARHMDDLARQEAERGSSVPIAFANWPTTDPLRHPEEPNANEDLVGVDANHILPTRRWPGGSFASFHAYPYYPDFLRHEPGLQRTVVAGEPDPYAGYLLRLKAHFAPHMPLLVTEFGVPSSLGSAHLGTRGRHQGAHDERTAMAMDAAMLRMFRDLGLGGGLVFSWTDEWFKRTWNTMAHQDPARRQLWHDPLTNEQWFGLIATDALPLPDAAADLSPRGGAFEYLWVRADASWVYLDIVSRGALPRTLTVEADVVPGMEKADYRLEVDVPAGVARLFVRRALDPIRLDTPRRPYRPGLRREWHPYALIINRDYRLGGRTLPAEYQDLSTLARGTWDPSDPAFDSTAMWSLDARRRTVRLRLPWSMLGMADPSARTALGEGNPAKLVHIRAIGLRITGDGSSAGLTFTWPIWNHAPWAERPKAGLETLAAAFRDTAG